MREIVVRVANENDKRHIAAFQKQMALETESLILDEPTVNRGVSEVFKKPDKGRYYVASIDGDIVASLMITYEWSDWRAATIWWIQSVYVMKNFRKQGIFKKMYCKIREMAEKNPEVAGLRLYVDKTNHSAIEVYHKIGMTNRHYDLFEWMKQP